MTARHKQSFYVSRTALILNALMGNIEIPGGYVIAKRPEYYGRKSLKPLAARVPKVNEARVDGAGTTWPSWDPAIGMVHQAFAAMETGKPYGIGPYFAYRHDPITAMPDTEALKRALDKLKLLVSIDVRYSELGWYADVILPESTYLERANILAQLPGQVPVFVMRDQAIAPRFDSRPAWWIFREILRRMDAKEALDFETIEEIWNYQLEGTGVTVAEMRESGIVSLADAPKRTPRDKLRFPTPSGKIEIESEALKKAGLPSLPPYQPKQAPTGDRFNLLFGRPPTLAHGQSLNNPILSGIAPKQQLWIHPDRAWAAGDPRRRSSRSQRRRHLRRTAQGARDAVDPPRCGVHAARLRRHSAGRHTRLRRRRGRPAAAARQALRLRPGRRRLCLDRDHRPGQARGRGGSDIMSMYTLRHDEAKCIGCQACEVACKTNKGLMADPAPCKIITVGPVDVEGRQGRATCSCPVFTARTHGVSRPVPDRGDAKTARKDGIVFVQSSLCVGCKSCMCRLSLGRSSVGPSHGQGGQVRLLHGSPRCGAAAGLRHQVRNRLPVLWRRQ